MEADKHNSWVEDDVAIEVIGKMIAVNNKLRNKLLTVFDFQGFGEADNEVQSDEKYIQYSSQIKQLRDEINMIYRGENIDQLLRKIENEYVPFLRNRYVETQHEIVV